jgi:hypothetical protein
VGEIAPEHNAYHQKNELGFSQASVDKHNEANTLELSQTQTQGRGRSLG